MRFLGVPYQGSFKQHGVFSFIHTYTPLRRTVTRLRQTCEIIQLLQSDEEAIDDVVDDGAMMVDVAAILNGSLVDELTLLIDTLQTQERFELALKLAHVGRIPVEYLAIDAVRMLRSEMAELKTPV